MRHHAGPGSRPDAAPAAALTRRPCLTLPLPLTLALTLALALTLRLSLRLCLAVQLACRLRAAQLVDRADGVPGRMWHLHRERPSGGRVRRPAALAQAWLAPAARAATGRREQ